MANQLGMVFAKLDCKPRWRERLPELAIPALVVHGRRDPFFPSATAKRSRARSPVRGCSCSNGPHGDPRRGHREVAAAMLAL
jgi:pimeloyl-ACP methyl ester carboxylesterase